MLDGAQPEPSLLRALAPVLGLRAADVFVLAGVPVPDDLAPLDPAAARDISWLMNVLSRLPAQARSQLRERVASLPRAQRAQGGSPPFYGQPDGSCGSVIMGMLGNRNLNLIGVAKALGLVTGGRLYFAQSTIAMIGHGRKELTPDLLTGFAALLDVPAEDLFTLAGIDLPGELEAPGPAAVELARLIWELRRLSAGQVRQVRDWAVSMEFDRT